MLDAIIFDADDTLWKTEPLYDVSLDLAQAEVECHGIDGAKWRLLQREIDLEAVKSTGFSADRFPLSSQRAYEQLAGRPDPEVAAKVNYLSREVFRAVAEPFAEVEATLRTLRDKGCKLGLITKGDLDVQNKRIADSGLASYFSAYVVVTAKTSDMFRAMCIMLNAGPGAAVSIGNSLSSDIAPALDVDIRGIWIDAYVWEHERNDTQELPDGVTALRSFSEIPDALASIWAQSALWSR